MCIIAGLCLCCLHVTKSGFLATRATCGLHRLETRNHGKNGSLLSPRFFKKASGILQLPLSVKLSPPKPLDDIQPNLVCELLT